VVQIRIFKAGKHAICKGAHACLIIGYNKITGELAVSNSWGAAENAPSWIPIKAAEKASQCNGFVLIPK
jgi:hypothetical protein